LSSQSAIIPRELGGWHGGLPLWGVIDPDGADRDDLESLIRRDSICNEIGIEALEQ